LVILISSILYSFYFQQAAPGKKIPDGPTPLIVRMPIIGKCLQYCSEIYYAYVYFTYQKIWPRWQ